MVRGRWVRGRPLRAGDFPAGSPLNHFFAWNESARRRDRRYVILCDLHCLLTGLGGDAGAQAAVAHIAVRPVILRRRGDRLLIADQAVPASADHEEDSDNPGLAAAREIVARLIKSIGSPDTAAHAALFAAFEKLAGGVDLYALAGSRPRLKRIPHTKEPRRILILRLSALGDFVQALGPAAAIRRHFRDDRIALLTTAPFADFAPRLGYFDEVMIDRRPGPFDVVGWLALRRALRRRRFDLVFDLQTSQRSAAYFQLFRPGRLPQWSGVVRGASHPHANLGRDTRHTIDKQAEQLLMAGIHPTLPPQLPPLDATLPPGLAGRRFVLIVPGSSPRHLGKRWPPAKFGMLAAALCQTGFVPVVIGAAGEAALGRAICEICPDALDLVGQTDLEGVAALAQRAALTVGNDTGVTHLAAAAPCPVVVLFSRASDPDWCAPRGDRVRVLAAPDLAGLEVAEVLAAAKRLLGEAEASPTGDGPQAALAVANTSGA